MIATWRFSVTVTFETDLAVPNGIVNDGPTAIDAWLANIGPLIKYDLCLKDTSYKDLKIVCISDERKNSQIRTNNGAVVYERNH